MERYSRLANYLVSAINWCYKRVAYIRDSRKVDPEVQCEYCKREYISGTGFVSLLATVNVLNTVRICRDCFKENAPDDLYKKLFP